MFGKKDKDKDKSRHVDHGPLTATTPDASTRSNTGNNHTFGMRRSTSSFYLSTPTAKSGTSFSTLDPTAQQAAYQQSAQAANTTERQISDDMVEVRNVVANYGVEPLEILHLSKSI